MFVHSVPFFIGVGTLGESNIDHANGGTRHISVEGVLHSDAHFRIKSQSNKIDDWLQPELDNTLLREPQPMQNGIRFDP